MKRIAIIPARSGSKRIPHKNIKDFLGKPIIAYAIQTALDSKIFDEVIVSTDSSEIASIAKDYGASVPFLRPLNLSDDTTPTIPVINHAIDELNLDSSDFACCIYPCTPLLLAEYLIQAKNIIESNKNLAYVYVASAYENSPFRSFYLKNNAPQMKFPQFKNTRSQDLEELYFDAGQFYYGRVSSFKGNLDIFAPHSYVIVLENLLIQDIDSVQDFELAKLKYKLLHKLN